MSTVEGVARTGLVARAINILFKPGAEWEVVAAEPASAPGLLLGYAAILALIPVVGVLIGRLFWAGLFHGFAFFGVATLIGGVVMAAVGYVLAVALIFVTALIANALAAGFGAQASQIQALKLIVYANTPALIAGIFNWIPLLGVLIYWGALAWASFLIFNGVAKLMKPPAEKATGYALAIIAAQIGFAFLHWLIMLALGAMAFFGAAATGAATLAHAANHDADLAKLEAASQQLQQAAKSGEDANGKPIAAVDPQQLKTLLPDTIAGLPRTEISAESAGTAGLGASDAEATYTAGDKHITLKVVDLAAVGGIAAMASAMHVESDKETATGYDKESTLNGRWTTERYDNQGKDGEYSILVGNRFEIDADGSGVTMDDLKGAVAAVGPDKLEGLAHG